MPETLELVLGDRIYIAKEDLDVMVRPTSFRTCREEESDRRVEFQALYGDLIADTSRNELICSDVWTAVDEGLSPVVMTERTEHLGRLYDALTRHRSAT